MSKRKLNIPKTTRFEDALVELETVVQKLEAGEQTLDKSLEDFERGIALARFCQQSLSDADHKVQVLLQDKGEPRLTNLNSIEE